MSAGDLAVTLAAVLCAVGFAALIVVLVRVLDALQSLRREVDALRNETRPLLVELQQSTAEARSAVQTARDDLERFDRVLGSAEAISGAVEGSGRVVRTALSTPAIKAAGVVTGVRRAVRRLRGRDQRLELVTATDASARPARRRRA